MARGDAVAPPVDHTRQRVLARHHYCRGVLDGSPRWPLVALVLLAVVAPFNFKPTMDAWTELQLRPLVIVALALAVVLTLRAVLVGCRRGIDPIDGLAYGWVVAVWLSALMSDDLAVGAGGAARLSVAALLIPATRSVVTSTADRMMILRALAVGSGVGALVGFGYWWLGADADGSRFFVGSVTQLGPLNRLTRPWSHANVAAMALGMTLPAAATFPRPWTRITALCAMTIALVLTISRGGLLAVAVAALVWVTLRRRRAEVWSIASLALVVAVVFLASSAWGARIDQLGDTAFYGGTIDAPADIVVDETEELIEVTIRNESTSTWRQSGDDQVLISARWIGPDGLVWIEDRWQLPADLAPGQTLTAPLRVTPRLPVGDYELRWDLLIDQVAYFGQFLGHPTVGSRGRVEASAASAAEIFPYNIVDHTVDIGRVDGWRLAWDEFTSSPLVGVGPNQFGDEAQSRLAADGLSVGSHAHNIVLEPLAAWGLVGAVPFLALGALAVRAAACEAWRTRELSATAIAAALVALITHGIVDWPLVVITTCIPVGLLLGLALSPVDES